MPISPTSPGVYIEEAPSGVRTIRGVATAVTAFLGRAPRGDVDTAVVVTSYADFERQYGGLAVDYPLSYAVRDFYLNGGTTAVIVRLYRSPSDTTTTGYAYLTLPPSTSSSGTGTTGTGA